mmetsp:Transcript_16716/g.35908  ORF Transcript_16716/g.35908 Transcript_16716/m.35908 type:complete len:208 (-) Transcript_16716:151-774(-)
MLPTIGRVNNPHHLRGGPNRVRKAWAADPPTSEVESESAGKWLERQCSVRSNDSPELNLWDTMDSDENVDMCRKAFSAATGTPWSSASRSSSDSDLSDKDMLRYRRVRLAPLNHVPAFNSADDNVHCDAVERERGFESPTGSGYIDVLQEDDYEKEHVPSPFRVPLPPPPRVGKTWSGRRFHRRCMPEEAKSEAEEDEPDMEAREEA